jgi:PAS domain S-box-containing protein
VDDTNRLVERQQTADAVRESEANYRTIFDTANDAIFVHDLATGAIVDVNHKATELYGMSREEALRLSVQDLSAGVAPYAQEQALERLQAAAAGTPQLFEWLAKDRAGRRFWVEVNLKRVAIGGHDRLLAMVRDIADRKRAEREIKRNHDSLKTLNALLHLALEDLQLEELLQRALALVLHNPWPATEGVGAVFLVDDVTGELVLKAHNGIDRHILERCARVPLGHCLCGRVALHGEALYCEGIDERHETTYVGISPHGHYCTPIAAGETILGVLNVYLEAGHAREAAEEQFLSGFASTLASIIVRKRAEESLRVADEQLREQAALVRLGEMAAVVAHEVKNPLAGIRGTIQVIGGRLPRGGRDAAVIGEVIARLDALDELMKDLLQFARPPQMRPALVDIMALARETTSLVGQDPAARDVLFEVEGSAPPVIADAKLLRIVLLNLLLNAAHALQHNGTISIVVASSERACRIAIADTGPGIPQEIRDRIFAPFFTTKSRGTGLGLSTAKRLVDAHHGRISIECPAGGGTVVTIELPREPGDHRFVRS